MAGLHDYILMARLFEAAACSPNFRLADLREIISPQQGIHVAGNQNTGRG
jgi:hypothetical protein